MCVSWFDDGTPPRNLERASVPVDIAALSGGEVLLAGYRQGRAAQHQPGSIDVTIRTATGAVCGTSRIMANTYLTGSETTGARPVCRFSGAPGYIGTQVDARFGRDAPLASRALLAVPECEATAGCTTWWTVSVRGSDREITGAVLVGVRTSGGAGTATIGVEHPANTDAPQVHGPRLRTEQVTVRPSASDPRAVVATWATDAPARVLVSATAEAAERGCPMKIFERSEQAAQGTLTLTGLCPGVRYYVAFDLMNDTGRTIYNAFNPPSIFGVDAVYQPWPVTTNAMSVAYDYRLEFTLNSGAGEGWITGVVPAFLDLEFPNDRVHEADHYTFTQFYDGRARFGLDCAEPAHYNRDRTGVELNVRGGTFAPSNASFLFDTYWPSAHGLTDTGQGRICPSVFNQFHKTPTIESKNCHFVMTKLTPVAGTNSLDNLLSGRAARFTASAQCRSNPVITLTATLVLRMHEAHTLHGHL